MRVNNDIILTQNEYTGAAAHLLDHFHIHGVLSEEIGVEDCQGYKAYSGRNLEELKAAGINLIVCNLANDAEIKRYTDQGWVYLENFFFIDECIRWILLSEIQHEYMDRTFVTWGCGWRGKEFMCGARELGLEIQYCIDTDEKKLGCQFEGKRIFTPSVLQKTKKEFVIVTADSYDEIKKELIARGFSEWKDFLHYKQFFDFSLIELITESVFKAPITSWKCQNPFRLLRLTPSGEIRCCHMAVWFKKPIGNAFLHSLKDIKNSLLYKAIQLSIINRNYVFCHTDRCEMLVNPARADYNTQMFKQTNDTCHCVDFDESCNLFCESCRDTVRISKGEDQEYLLNYFRKNILPETDILMVAGQGEVFLSKYYNDLLDGIRQSELKGILLLSNGILFNEKKVLKWREKVDGNIGCAISVDAASEETYLEVRRGGDFKILRDQLEKIGEMRSTNQIKLFDLMFVMQRKNYKEMLEFVEMAEQLNVDAVNFTKIDNWGTYTDEQYEQICMYEKSGKPTEQLEQEFRKIKQRKSKVKVFLNDCYGYRLFVYERLAVKNRDV